MNSSTCLPPQRGAVFPPALTHTFAALALLIAGTAFAVGDPPPDPTTPPGDTTGLGLIQRVVIGTAPCDTCPPRVCAGQPFPVTISGVLPSPCYVFRGFHELPVGAPFIALAAEFSVDTCGVACPAVEVPFSASLTLPPMTVGTGFFVLAQNVRSCPDSLSGETRTRQYTFAVQECDSVPPPRPPLDSLVRNLTRFDVVPERRCPGDSLALRMTLNGCPPCADLISLTNDSLGGIHAEVQWQLNCVNVACSRDTLEVALGRFAAGFHVINVNVDVRVLNPPGPDTTVSYVQSVPFEVPLHCDSTGCVQPWLFARSNDNGCALEVEPGRRAPLTLSVVTPTPLAGLQGELHCSEPFRIVAVRPPLGIPQIHVTWVPDGRGARYVLFTSGGAVIPPGQSPVLTVGIQADESAVSGQRGSLVAPIQVASGPGGENVPICTTERLVVVPLCVTSAADSCDANGDGRTDVRDLVAMLSCLRLTVPDSGAVRCPDCDGDSAFTFADVLCCARHILRGPFVPRDSVHSNSSLRVTLESERYGDGLYVRARLAGIDGLAGAMVRLRYPAERWRIEFPLIDSPDPDPTEGWYPLMDTEEPGVIQLGGIRMQDPASGEIEFRFAIVPTGPGDPSDQLIVEGADLVAPDGTVLTPSLPLPIMSLDAPTPPQGTPTGIELSAARPNPFSSATSFTVSLPREANVDLAVHDLAGRRVETLASGRLPAGRKDFTWSGVGSRDGVYFVRLTVEGKVYSTRAALLRARR